MNMGFQSIENLVTCLIFNVNNLIQTLKWLNHVLLLKLPSSDTCRCFLEKANLTRGGQQLFPNNSDNLFNCAISKSQATFQAGVLQC